MIIEKISYSRLGVFDQCAYQYRLHYHDKIKSPLPEPPYFEYGHYMHKMAELVVEECISISEASKKAFKEHNKFGPEYIKRAPGMIRNFEEFQKYIKMSKPINDQAEVEFNLERDGFKLNGFIDRAITYENDRTLIADYKTSKSNNEIKQKDIHGSKQLMMYVWAYNQITGVPIEKISAMLLYLESGHKPITKFTPEQVEDYMSSAIRSGQIIKDMKPEDARANINRLCGWCEYRTICKSYLQSK